MGRETQEGRAYREQITGVKPPPLPPPTNTRVYNETTLNSLKHRLLTYMYNQAKGEGLYALRRYTNTELLLKTNNFDKGLGGTVV